MILPLVGGTFKLPEPSCERVPSCVDWVFGRCEAIPDHFCSFVGYWSVQRFVQEWGLAHPLGPAYLSTWPLPVGYRALNMWYDRRLPLEIPEGPLGERLTLLAQSLSKPSDVVRTPAHTAVMVHCRSAVHPLAALITDPDAWLITAISRRLSAGRIWLLVPAKLEGSGAIEYRAGTGNPGGIWYGWDPAGEEYITIGRGDGSVSSLRYNWSIGFPYVVTASVGGGDEAAVFGTDLQALSLRPLRDLHDAGRSLASAWITAGMGGRLKKSGGKIGYWPYPADFIAELTKTIESLKGYRKTRELVADAMGIPTDTLDYNLKRFRPPLRWRDAQRLDFLRAFSPPDEWPNT